MFTEKIITNVLVILGFLKFVRGKTCRFYPSYPEYGTIYSIDCYLDCCPIEFPKTAQSACCDRSLSWLWIVLPCFFGLAIIAIVVVAVCIFLLTKKNKVEPRVINVEAVQCNDDGPVTTSYQNGMTTRNENFMINPLPSYQVLYQEQEVMPYLPNNTMVSNRGYFIQNENIY